MEPTPQRIGRTTHPNSSTKSSNEHPKNIQEPRELGRLSMDKLPAEPFIVDKRNSDNEDFMGANDDDCWSVTGDHGSLSDAKQDFVTTAETKDSEENIGLAIQQHSNPQDRLEELLNQTKCPVFQCKRLPFGRKQGMKQHLRGHFGLPRGSHGPITCLFGCMSSKEPEKVFVHMCKVHYTFILDVIEGPRAERHWSTRATKGSIRPYRSKGQGKFERHCIDGPSESKEQASAFKHPPLPVLPHDDDVASMFSSGAPSIFSAGTGYSAITENTQYSDADIASATHQLVEVFCTDEDLHPLYEEAMRNESIGAERFARNFRRLLNVYSNELKDAAGDSQQYLAARLVRWKAREVADMIRERYDSEPAFPKERSTPQPPREPADDFVGDDSSDDEDPGTFEQDRVETLAPVRDFLVNGAAFENLKGKFEVFVRPPVRVGQRAHGVEDLRETTSPVTITENEGWYDTFTNFAIGLGLMEPPLKEGKQRLRWRCRCGTNIYDDYVELRPGALDELRNSLQKWSAAPGGPATSHSTTRKSGSFLSKISDMVPNPFRSGSRASPADPCIPLHNTPSNATASQSNTSNPKPEPLHLLLCMKEGRFGTALYQEDIRELRCDHDLFRFLRHCYTLRRGALRSLLSLRAPAAINFVMFNLVTGNIVNLRTCPCTPTTCTCLPPRTKAEYSCDPNPAGRCPPIGPDTLMHLFTHPACFAACKPDARILAQFPKKLQGDLSEDYGWGIHIREGWNRVLVKVVLLVYIVGSMVFGVAWWAGKWDVQGAFGVTGYMINVGTAFLAYVAVSDL